MIRSSVKSLVRGGSVKLQLFFVTAPILTDRGVTKVKIGAAAKKLPQPLTLMHDAGIDETR